MAAPVRDALHGTLDALILKTLTWGPRHGYAVSEWIEHDVSQDKWGTHEAVTLWVRLRNDSGSVVSVTPTVFVAPTRYRR